jgi:uncharacterized YccA/Bax inhibitor family protein
LRIEKAWNKKMPKYMEWFGAMGLNDYLVWYIEFFKIAF